MNLFIYILSILLFLRALVVAIGKLQWKAKFEKVLLYQKIILFFLLFLIIYSFVDQSNFFIFAGLANMAILLPFYLQPTPRISKLILIIFSILNFLIILLNFAKI